MNPFSSLAFSFPTLVITIPSTIVVLVQVFSLYGSKLRINSASLFSLGFISMFVAGGVSGFFLAQPSIDIMLHATYFVVGHFHMVMGVAAMFGIFAGTYFWFPKMTGRMMNETLGKAHFWLSFVGAYCIFMPFHYLDWPEMCAATRHLWMTSCNRLFRCIGLSPSLRCSPVRPS